MSPQQKEVLRLMESGKSFDRAYNEVGLSDYGHNRAVFLLRLVQNGHVKISVKTSTTTTTKE